jgi:hypothetical protein
MRTANAMRLATLRSMYRHPRRVWPGQPHASRAPAPPAARLIGQESRFASGRRLGRLRRWCQRFLGWHAPSASLVCSRAVIHRRIETPMQLATWAGRHGRPARRPERAEPLRCHANRHRRQRQIQVPIGHHGIHAEAEDVHDQRERASAKPDGEPFVTGHSGSPTHKNSRRAHKNEAAQNR